MKLPPSESAKAIFGALYFTYRELPKLHKNRARSPLRFTDAFYRMEHGVDTASEWAWDATRGSLRAMELMLDQYRGDYNACLGAARSQRERNEMWDMLHGPRNHALQGGRADGNKSR